MKTRALYSFAVLFVVTSLLLSACAAGAPAATPTNTPIPSTDTPEPTATTAPTSTSTPKPTVTLTPTITPNMTGTQQVKDFTAKVKEYYDAKYISTTDGTYDSLKDKTISWAKLNYYLPESTGFSPTNFIVKSDMVWNSASAASDSSGCGYMFRIQDNQDHYMFYVSLKGYVEMATYTSKSWKSMGRGVFGSAAQKGKATVVLIAEDSKFQVIINDKLIKTYTGFAGKLSSGDLGYTVLSGTNKSFGIQCKFNNTELWTINQK